MNGGGYPGILRAIWALLAIFAALQVLLWAVGVAPRTPFFVFHIVGSWAFIVALALLATRRIGLLSTAIELRAGRWVWP